MSNFAYFNGWILPNGELLGCLPGDHLDTAVDAGESDPDSAGWIHVEFGDAGLGGDFQPSRKQVDTIVQICLATGRALPKELTS